MTGRPVRVLFCALRWDYGDRARGDSFEYVNLFDAMQRMAGVEASFFDLGAADASAGKAGVGLRLNATVRELEPDVAFFVSFRNDVPTEVLAELRDRVRPFTVNWFGDDHWRFDTYSRHMASLFNGVTTTDRDAIAKYRALGIEHAFLTQWGCNQFRYQPTGRPAEWDVSFVGQPHSSRRWIIRRLKRRDIDVRTWGRGWPAGRISHEEMVAVFSESKINLNLTNASVSSRVPRHVTAAVNRIHPPLLARLGIPEPDQIKGRHFEIPACGGFQLSGTAAYLEDFFEPGYEIAVFSSQEELEESIERYLSDDAARERIAAAGCRRALAEHTYERRFRGIFRHFGFA
jgi:spore maturation protein CgeB